MYDPDELRRPEGEQDDQTGVEREGVDVGQPDADGEQAPETPRPE